MKMRFVIAGLLAGAATTGHAQTVPTTNAAIPETVSVADRPRPDFAPIGGRIGSFFLYPRIDTSVSYTDNLRATPSGKISDEVFLLRPSIDVQSIWTRNMLEANAYYSRDFYLKYTEEDTSQYGGHLTTRLDATNTTTLLTTISVDKLAEPRTDVNSIASARSPVSYSQVSVSGNLTQSFSKLGVTLGGYVTRQMFDNNETFSGTPLFLKYRNNTYSSVFVEGRYPIGPSTSAIVHLERSQLDYEYNGLVGYDRDSHLYRGEVGLGFRITNLLQGDVRVGYLKQDNDDARFIDSSGVSFNANLLYNVTALTSVRLNASRTLEPGSSTITSGNLRSSAAVTVEHELLPDLVLTGTGRYSHIKPEGPLIGANEYEATIGALYYINRRFRLSVTADRFTRHTPVSPLAAYAPFDADNISLGLAVTF